MANGYNLRRCWLTSISLFTFNSCASSSSVLYLRRDLKSRESDAFHELIIEGGEEEENKNNKNKSEQEQEQDGQGQGQRQGQEQEG